MESSFGLLLVLITLAIIHIVQAQDQQGFITLDCGLPANELSPYKERYTGLPFSSDENFIQSGKTGRVQANQEGKYSKQYDTLRYFPEGKRNCYNLSVEKGRKYLIRASFVYGNYDGRYIAPVFDLYLGPNPWATIDLEKLVNGTEEEILHIPTSNSLRICLVKTGETTPLISTLELRPMRNDSYVTKSGSLRFSFRSYLNNSRSPLRYPGDIYDRIWRPYFKTEWTQISTALEDSLVWIAGYPPYKERYTGLQFSSDATFIQSGKTGRIQANRESEFLKPYTRLRYFADGIRNCYNLRIQKGRKHLIRAWFLYGNYDGLDINPKFDLYVSGYQRAKRVSCV